MEVLANRISEFLDNGYGGGSGFGTGYGSGDGSGDGYGHGYGSGDGSDIKSFNGRTVHRIDGLQTCITSVARDIARGFIINVDLTTTKTYIARCGGYFAHGETPEDAMRDAQAKHEESLPVSERIERFLAQYSLNQKYSGHQFFDAHRMLTGSCEQGRKSFVKNTGVDLDQKFTVQEFIDMVRNQYGAEVILQLEQKIKEAE